jgi:hypothetical protein
MLTLILLIPLIAIAILFIGFLEIRIPFLSVPSDVYLKFRKMRKANKHVRKMMRKKLWHDQMHKGFVQLPTASAS